MKKILLEVSENEKKRILELHNSKKNIVLEGDPPETKKTEPNVVTDLSKVVPLEKRLELFKFLSKIPEVKTNLNLTIQPLITKNPKDTSLLGDIKEIGDKISDLGLNISVNKTIGTSAGGNILNIKTPSGKEFKLNLNLGYNKKSQTPTVAGGITYTF